MAKNIQTELLHLPHVPEDNQVTSPLSLLHSGRASSAEDTVAHIKEAMGHPLKATSTVRPSDVPGLIVTVQPSVALR